LAAKDDGRETPLKDIGMNTKLTVLAALLFAGASQAALAQDQGHDRGGDRPQVQGQPNAGGGRWNGGGERHWNGGGQPGGQPAPQARPAPQAQPGGGRWNGAGGERQWNGGGERRQFQPQQPAPGVAPQAQPGQPQPGQRYDRGGDRRWNGRNGFAPGGTANGDRRWDRNDAPREVTPPGPNAERGWDREHDGHGPAPGYANRPPRDGDRRWAGDGRRWDGDRGWDRDRRGPPANWQRWERGRFPPVYAAQRRFHIGPYSPPYGWYVRSWGFGDFLPRGWFGQPYWIDDFWYYDLPYPPPGFHWVRVGDDALLVDDYSGRVVQVVDDIFW
jgi:Ni/Co efflux regulator RcnB